MLIHHSSPYYKAVEWGSCSENDMFWPKSPEVIGWGSIVHVVLLGDICPSVDVPHLSLLLIIIKICFDQTMVIRQRLITIYN